MVQGNCFSSDGLQTPVLCVLFTDGMMFNVQSSLQLEHLQINLDGVVNLAAQSVVLCSGEYCNLSMIDVLLVGTGKLDPLYGALSVEGGNVYARGADAARNYYASHNLMRCP